MSLQLTVGHVSATGPRERNEDFCGFVTPERAQLADKGAMVALADGVSGGAGGREAAEYTVRGLLADYYATPDTWEVPFALDKVLTAINRWLISQATTRRDLAGMSCTLSALVLRGCRYYLAHVGDSRIYRLRDGQFMQLTTDHVWDRPDMRHVLKRAVGLDQHLSIDFGEGDLQTGDVFLLVSDGVWEPVGELGMLTTLNLYKNPQLTAEELVRQAHKQGGQDNASAMVVRIDAVPEQNLRDQLSAERNLPIPPRLKAETRLDGFEVVALLHESRMSLLYQVRRLADGRLWVLKTLPPQVTGDVAAANALIQEEWLAKKVIAHYFPQILPLASEERSALYYVMSWHDGATLQQYLDSGRHFAVAETVQIGIRLVKGLAALHRLNILHRDIKPGNIHLGADDKLRILDFGVAASEGLHDLKDGAGTPSFMAPELISGEAASVQSELYAAGVTLYYLLTRKYPYGEVEPFQHPRFGDPVPPTRYRPEIPHWLENMLLKAVARDPRARFETAEEMLLALEQGERRPLDAPRRTPLLERDPMRFWQMLALFSIALNLMLIYLMVAS
ncbi:bifunctional protein-serine/threonine kinase/phosphatase [Sulfuriferula thiophila]|uniref:bifunctional protein-serine/threonine kinase/phosphatase n=1 Tax=Sulfuriferula thiophila TaxID=1781211 RepID=UPI000F608E9C|nr:bifunctional protein-serine/threonine kinase/phosphatase [Sulfuriferula thiophila]